VCNKLSESIMHGATIMIKGRTLILLLVLDNMVGDSGGVSV
jgi:hypothetical protein